jgi:hypothetical protein
MTEEKTENLQPSVQQLPNQQDSPTRLLPRSGWNSQVNYLRALFRAKKALDRIEKEAGIVLNNN